jgi:DNA-binding NarL/FixJ family response regulator
MKILLADDHPLFREGVKPVLMKLDAQVELLEADDYPSAFNAMHHTCDVDLALLDLYMPGMAGIEGIVRFRQAFPDIPVVVLSAAEQFEDIQTMLDVGILGYINKSSSSDFILNALQQVLAGRIYIPHHLMDLHQTANRMLEEAMPDFSWNSIELSERQSQVLNGVARGLTNQQIAKLLPTSEGTVKAHVSTLLRKFNLTNRSELMLMCLKTGLDKLQREQ